ncbi:MAG TPA: phosphatidylglycerophosphatase A [Verrucomicrobiae bacterium]|jgi:phosphatidylglycerophosphatase A
MKLWIAQGFGAGRIPFAPGTFGSVVGLGWLAALMCLKSWPLFIAGNVAAVALSVWLCGEGERLLGRKDPGSVVLDEIVAIPICFAAWLVSAWAPHHAWPGAAFLWQHWASSIGIFALFRFFDILKPWPVRQSQNLPGGWGVTVDDVLAAVYVNAVVLAVIAVRR